MKQVMLPYSRKRGAWPPRRGLRYGIASIAGGEPVLSMQLLFVLQVGVTLTLFPVSILETLPSAVSTLQAWVLGWIGKS